MLHGEHVFWCIANTSHFIVTHRCSLCVIHTVELFGPTVDKQCVASYLQPIIMWNVLVKENMSCASMYFLVWSRLIKMLNTTKLLVNCYIYNNYRQAKKLTLMNYDTWQRIPLLTLLFPPLCAPSSRGRTKKILSGYLIYVQQSHGDWRRDQDVCWKRISNHNKHTQEQKNQFAAIYAWKDFKILFKHKGLQKRQLN